MTVAREAIVRLVRDPLEIVRCRSPQQKPFVRIHLDNGLVVDLPFDLEERIHTEVVMYRTMSEVTSAPVIALKHYKPRRKP